MNEIEWRFVVVSAASLSVPVVADVDDGEEDEERQGHREDEQEARGDQLGQRVGANTVQHPALQQPSQYQGIWNITYYLHIIYVGNKALKNAKKQETICMPMRF